MTQKLRVTKFEQSIMIEQDLAYMCANFKVSILKVALIWVKWWEMNDRLQKVIDGLFIIPLYLMYCNSFSTKDDKILRTVFTRLISLILIDVNLILHF